MGIIVQKFGGTSVRTPESRNALLKKVKMEIDNGHSVVVVVSAMGRSGEPYATDTLIKLLNDISSDISPRKKDLIMSCGEIISCSIVSHLLEINGIPSEALTGFQAGILTNAEHTHSDINFINTTNILQVIKNGKVPVIAGFQGSTSNLEITTLGRGGSDTSAVIIGGYLKADRVDIYTDVKGIAQIDPRIIPHAEYLKEISYKNMLKLSINGAKVIHPRAVSASQNFNIPVKVKSTFLDDDGTLIHETINEKVTGNLLGITSQKDLLSFEINKDSEYYKVLEELSIYSKSSDLKSKFYILNDSTDIINNFMSLNIEFDEILYGKVSVFFNNIISNDLKSKLEVSLKALSNNVFDTIWEDDSLSFIVSSNTVNEFSKEIYEIITKF